MSKKLKSAGFTIVEMMFVLAISGMLVVTTIVFFRGRQERTQFTQGVNEIESQIKTIMNEVVTGYYPNNGSFSCSEGASGPVINVNTNGNQGENEDCIFLGKTISFFNNSADYTAYTVVGLRKFGDSLATGLADSKPTISEDIKESYKLPWGISVSKVISSRGVNAPLPIGSVGVISSLGEFSANPLDDDVSGAQTADLVPIGSGLNTNFANIQAQVKLLTDSDRRPDKITVCLVSGSRDRKAAIILGGKGKQLNTEVVIDNVPSECN